MKADVNAVVVNVGDDKHHLDIALENKTPKILVMISSKKYYEEIIGKEFSNVLVRYSRDNLEIIKTIQVDPFKRTEPESREEFAELPVIGEIIDKFSSMKKEIERDSQNKNYNINWIASLNGGTNQQIAAMTMLAIMYNMRTYYVIDRKKDLTLHRHGGAGGCELFNWVPFISDIYEGIHYIEKTPAQREALRVLVYQSTPSTSEQLADLLRNNKWGQSYPGITKSMISKRVIPLTKKGFIEKIGLRPYEYNATELGKVVVRMRWPKINSKEN